MDETSNEKKVTKLTLEELLGQRFIRNDEADAIGELLYALQHTEYLMTLIIGMWGFPIAGSRFDYMLDDLLMKVPWQDKIKFIRNQRFLQEEDAGKLQKLFQDRNFLAHPRSPETRVTHRFPVKERDRILSFLREIDNKLNVHARELKKEVIGKYLSLKYSDK